jgi:hypothetical protein
MGIKDFLALLVSVIAITLSLVTFYLQRIRKKDKVIGHLISTGDVKSQGNYDQYAEYSISNIGDTQLVIKNVKVLKPYPWGFDEFTSQTNNVPFILKPNEISIVNVTYDSRHFKPENIVHIEFGIFSPNGRGYKLRHSFGQLLDSIDGQWDIFILNKEHEVS